MSGGTAPTCRWNDRLLIAKSRSCRAGKPGETFFLVSPGGPASSSSVKHNRTAQVLEPHGHDLVGRAVDVDLTEELKAGGRRQLTWPAGSAFWKRGSGPNEASSAFGRRVPALSGPLTNYQNSVKAW